jgi:hypothetical protein
MIIVAIDVPPPHYPIAQEEQHIEFDLYEAEGLGFRFLRDDLEHFSRGKGTSNAPVRSMRTADAIGSPWRVRTSASAIDRTLDVAAPASDTPLDIPGQLAEIRRLTGYSWEQLAGLVGCTRQAAHRWMNGEPIADGNRERLARLHAALRFIDRGAADENRAVLDMAADGMTVADLLRQERFDEAKAVAGRGPGRQDAGWGRPAVVQPQPEEHWYSQLVLEEDAADNVPVRAKPQTIKRLQLRKG